MTWGREEEKHAADDEDASRLPSSFLCHSNTYSEPASVHRHDNGHAGKEPGEVGLMAHGGRGSVERDAEQEEDAVDRPATDLVAQGRPEEPEQAGEKERNGGACEDEWDREAQGRERRGLCFSPSADVEEAEEADDAARLQCRDAAVEHVLHPPGIKPERSMRGSTQSAQQPDKPPVHHPA